MTYPNKIVFNGKLFNDSDNGFLQLNKKICLIIVVAALVFQSIISFWAIRQQTIWTWRRRPTHLLFHQFVLQFIPLLCSFWQTYFSFMCLSFNFRMSPDNLHFASLYFVLYISDCYLCCSVFSLNWCRRSNSLLSCKWMFLFAITLDASSIASAEACFYCEHHLVLEMDLDCNQKLLRWRSNSSSVKVIPFLSLYGGCHHPELNRDSCWGWCSQQSSTSDANISTRSFLRHWN